MRHRYIVPFRELGEVEGLLYFVMDYVAGTDAGRLLLSRGGSLMHVNGNSVVVDSDHEYPRLYAQFQQLIDERLSDVDVAPLRLVADAFMYGKRVVVEPFVE